MQGLHSHTDLFLSDRCFLMIGSDPKTFFEASQDPRWISAMDEEYQSLQKNETWELVSLPPGRKLVQCKWVYKIKMGSYGVTYKYKARLVAKCFPQVQEIDYTDTFAPVANMDSIHLVLALAASKHWEVLHMDVKSAFLLGDLEKEIYIKQIEGYIDDHPLVCRLRESLYGIKQAPRAWYAKMDSFLLSQYFQRCKSDSNVYMRHDGNSLRLIVLYVDDRLIIGSLFMH